MQLCTGNMLLTSVGTSSLRAMSGSSVVSLQFISAGTTFEKTKKIQKSIP